MRIPRSIAFPATGVAMAVALALGLSVAATDVSAQGRGGKPSAGSGGHGGWSGGSGGGRSGWQSGSGGRGNWSGDARGRGNWDGQRGRWDGRHADVAWRGGHWRGHHNWHGWHGGRYYYPGWALGLGLGIGLTYPWWGWGAWPGPYVVYDRVVYEPLPERPVGVVIDRDAPPPAQRAPGYRWYCPSTGYHPEVQDCPAGWLKVLPPDGQTSPPAPGAPRSSAPIDEPAPASLGGAPVLGGMSGPRLAAPRTMPPEQVGTSPGALAVFAH